MKLKITWVNRNIGEEGIRVYRFETPTTEIGDATPLATLPPGTNEYIDETVIQNRVYWYLFEVFKGTDSFVSNPVSARATPYTGPGPEVLRTGDFNRGYFGIIEEDTFISPAEVMTLLNLTDGTNSTTPNNWHKFAYENDIYLLPTAATKTSIRWRQLYEAGLIYGEDGPGIPELDRPEVNQNRIIEINGDRYQVSTMTALYPGAPVELWTTGTDFVEEIDKSMWNSMVLAITVGGTTDERYREGLAFLSTGTVAFQTEILRDLVTPTYAAIRSNLLRSSIGANSAASWRPLLRLIP